MLHLALAQIRYGESGVLEDASQEPSWKVAGMHGDDGSVACCWMLQDEMRPALSLREEAAPLQEAHDLLGRWHLLAYGD